MREDATVLVLDDDHDFAGTLKSVLEAKGYPAIEAHDGASALRIVKTRSVAVAVVDLKLDDMPGIEVLRKIKQRAPATECILLTGYASQEIAIEAINLGGFGFLQKPCDLDQLLVMVRRAVEKRDALEALRESEWHTRAILHSSLDAVVTLDDLGVVIDWNPQAERTLGYARREALGREFFDLVFRSEDEALRKAWGAPAEIGLLGRPVEAQLRHKDGHEILVEWAVTSVEVAERRTFTFFIEDVSHRRLLEEQFLRAQRMEAVGLLAGGVLHDFNNVLTAVMGQSALLRQDATLGGEQQQMSQDIFDAAQRASGLARQLLAYSRPQVREPRLVDLNTVVIDLSRLLKRVLGEHIDVRKQLDRDLHLVEIDRSELEQVIVNLVLNARDAMPQGGVLRIETDNVTLDEMPQPVPGKRNRGRVRLRIRDYGAGMDPTTKIRAFEPFFTTKSSGKRPGLGLSTSKGIIEESGGEISLESEPGKGTTCSILLPARRAPKELEHRPEPAAMRGGTENVLVVEDDAIVRKTIVRILRRYGYQVLDAANGEEALSLARQDEDPLDLLIADVVMPKMSGPELAGKLTEMRRGTRVLFISGYREDFMIRQGLASKGSEFLAKPFTPEALLGRIRAILDAPRGET